jgi:hypothetical protein
VGLQVRRKPTMKLVRKWSYTYNSYDKWIVSLFKEGDEESPYWYFTVQNGNNSTFFESYMNGNPRTEPSLAEVLLSFVYIVTRVSNYMPLEAEELFTEEDNG